MKKYLLLVFVLSVLFACKNETKKNNPTLINSNSISSNVKQSPDQLFPKLFDAVQMGSVFPDSKYFVDCEPKVDPTTLDNIYTSAKDTKNFKLKDFVLKYFKTPAENSLIAINQNVTTEAHVNELWEKLLRKPDSVSSYSSLLPMPNAYIVPGGRFREVYYWDSYFTMLGLEESNKFDIIHNMIDNFSFLIDKYGFIPNGNRSYYLTRSQPPFFTCMVQLLANHEGEGIYTKYHNAIQKEYDFWMQKNAKDAISKHVVMLDDINSLNRYFDEGNTPRPESYREDVATAKNTGKDIKTAYTDLRSGACSGWDYSTRWFGDGKNINTIHTTDIIPVDLNALLYNMEMVLSKSYSIKGDKTLAVKYAALATRRKELLIQYCWNETEGMFFDYDFKSKKQTNIRSLATMYPLFFEMVDPKMATKVAVNVKKYFLQPGGLTTTTIKSGQQWDAPNGWAPLQWISIKGLMNYNQNELALDIANRWVNINEKVFKSTGKMMEKYNVVDTKLISGGGEYPSQDGFGWTNGVYLKLKKIVTKK
jgi:alpha,alpha-trehalase